ALQRNELGWTFLLRNSSDSLPHPSRIASPSRRYVRCISLVAFRAPYDLIMHTQLIRTATKRLDSLHAATYFSPLMTASYDQIGLDRPAQYFASRSCALGAASAELVTATFYSFSPALIGKSVPLCWE